MKGGNYKLRGDRGFKGRGLEKELALSHILLLGTDYQPPKHIKNVKRRETF